MFVIKASFLPELLREYKPELKKTLTKLAVVVWNDEVHCNKVLKVVRPRLQKSLFTALCGARSVGRPRRCFSSNI